MTYCRWRDAKFFRCTTETAASGNSGKDGKLRQVRAIH